MFYGAKKFFFDSIKLLPLRGFLKLRNSFFYKKGVAVPRSFVLSFHLPLSKDGPEKNKTAKGK
jgi:hypothetical protein